ncbi:unnamed protein product [Zymoseptoria tritici ST99CH_3D1]|nr:unnamed protein product [Zymoseptoria tritici ST99CH_3D1]
MAPNGTPTPAESKDWQKARTKRPDSGIDIKDDYVLTRDASASARLNLSHYIWQSSFGFNLHPRIQEAVAGKENLQVADIGTGTGIWLLDMANQLPPSTHFDGLDISFSQCTPPAWLPPNITLRQTDVLQPPPPELLAKFDIIHIRHFVCVVASNDPAPLLRNLLAMLKPGGWLQWGEWDVLNRHFTKVSPETPQVCIDALGEELAKLRPSRQPKWTSRLDEYMLLENVEMVMMEKRLSSVGHLPAMHDLTMLVFQELIDGVESRGLLGQEKVRELRTLLGGAVRESRAGVAWNLTRCMAVGRKGVDGRGRAFLN